jgi:MarR-like DNA-binding transcriptional regulator SgrR of sgrS sRNA
MSKGFKFGFIIAGLTIALSAFLLIEKNGSNMHSSPSSRNMTAVLTGKLSFPLVPENISTIPLYHVHYNLWGRLLSENGHPSLASLTNVTNGEKSFHFQLNPSARFSNGRTITSQDVEFSFRRLMAKQPAGHFSANNLIEAIRVISPTQFEIELKEKTSAFLYLLSTPEMGIVPKEDCDSLRAIKDLKITSGPYTVDGAPREDQITLKKNPYFINSNIQAPEFVTVLFRIGQEVLEAFEKQNADFLETYGAGGPKVLDSLKRQRDVEIKTTRPSLSVFMTANTKRLSTDERLSVAELLHHDLKYKLNPETEEVSDQILPPGTFGSLPKQSIPPQIPTKRTLPKKIRLASFDPTGVLLSAIIETLHSAGIEVDLVGFSELETSDLGFLGQGMNSDFPEIEFYLNMLSKWKFIDSTDDEKTLIMNTLRSANKKQREENIEKIGHSLIADARIIPILVRSYIHAFRRRRIDIDPVIAYDGAIPFWKMAIKQ